MNHVVAYQILANELEGYRALGYDELVRLVGQSFSSRKKAADCMEYEIDVSVWERSWSMG